MKKNTKPTNPSKVLRSEKEIQKTFFEIYSCPIQRGIIEYLGNKPARECDLIKHTGETRRKVSAALKILYNRNIIDKRIRDGNEKGYEFFLTPFGKECYLFIKNIKTFFKGHSVKLNYFVNEMKKKRS